MTETRNFERSDAPAGLLAMWQEIDDKTFGAGFGCFAEGAVCNLGVADWHGREAIRANLKAFIDTGFTASHEVKEYWDGGALKMFGGTVTIHADRPPPDRPVVLRRRGPDRRHRTVRGVVPPADVTHRLYGLTREPVRDVMGLRIVPDGSMADAPPLDIVHVPRRAGAARVDG